MGRASKSAKLGTPQWIGGTFDALGKINQDDPVRRARKVKVGLAFWPLAFFQPHERTQQHRAASESEVEGEERESIYELKLCKCHKNTELSVCGRV